MSTTALLLIRRRYTIYYGRTRHPVNQLRTMHPAWVYIRSVYSTVRCTEVYIYVYIVAVQDTLWTDYILWPYNVRHMGIYIYIYIYIHLCDLRSTPFRRLETHLVRLRRLVRLRSEGVQNTGVSKLEKFMIWCSPLVSPTFCFFLNIYDPWRAPKRAYLYGSDLYPV